MAGVVGSLLSPWQQLRDRVRWAMKNQPKRGRSGSGYPCPLPFQPGSNCKPSTTRRWRGPLWTRTDFCFTTRMEGACLYRVGLLVPSQPMFLILNTVLQIRIWRNWRQHLNDSVLTISVLFLLFLLRVLILNQSVVHVYVHTHTHAYFHMCRYICMCICTCIHMCVPVEAGGHLHVSFRCHPL